MRTAALTFILMLLSQGCSAQTDLYLIALMGQSNMEGRGELSELPAGFPANPTKLWNLTKCALIPQVVWVDSLSETALPAFKSAFQTPQ